MTRPLKICLIGCGKMGSSLLLGWVNDKKLNFEITVIDPVSSKDLENYYSLKNNINFFKSVKNLDKNYIAELVVLAVKPQIISKVLVGLKEIYNKKTIFLSIAAGISCKQIKSYTNNNVIICRAMPNTPASIGKGITCILKNKKLDLKKTKLIEQALKASGKIVTIDSEKDMDAVTALSGSGPAYIFLITEILTQVGYELGLGKKLSENLARETVIGSAYLLDKKSTSATILRKNVTSEGGTTAAALDIFLKNDLLKNIFFEAMNAAKNRSEELNKKNITHD